MLRAVRVPFREDLMMVLLKHEVLIGCSVSIGCAEFGDMSTLYMAKMTSFCCLSIPDPSKLDLVISKIFSRLY